MYRITYSTEAGRITTYVAHARTPFEAVQHAQLAHGDRLVSVVEVDEEGCPV